MLPCGIGWIKDVGSRVHNSILFLWAVGWRKLARMDLVFCLYELVTTFSIHSSTHKGNKLYLFFLGNLITP
ncbi:hypothetical protein PRUPE_1G265400 [Prunus persica]|uniref:Uncharacterized protein n=1 Tax=Prunus persica TaxID=3760 RepID=A0A251R3M9_PRUPE|nr:hypothetical protein PRUPE_1G265400 [Prunus persica]